MRDHLLYELARDLSSSLELDVVLGKVMDRVITLMSASRGFIVLVDPVTNTMSVKMSSGEADPEKIGLFLGSRTVIEQVVRTGQAVVATDASLDDRFKGQQSVILQNLRSIIAVPLVTTSPAMSGSVLKISFSRLASASHWSSVSSLLARFENCSNSGRV